MTSEWPRFSDHVPAGLLAVRGELDESLDRARRGFEQYVESPEDASPLHHAALELHQIRGTASIIQCFGAAALAEDMKQSVQDLLQHRASDVDATQAAVMAALVQMGDYIDALSLGFDDCVLVLQPVINEMRIARGRPLLTERELFVAQMHALGADASPAPLPAEAGEDAQALAQRLLHSYQNALLLWLRGESMVKSVARVGRIAEMVSDAASEPAVHQLWRIVAAAVEAVLIHSLDDTLEVKRLLGRAGLQLKLLSESGEMAAGAQIGDLGYQLLFHVGRARGSGPRIAAARSRHRLDVYLPTPSALEQLRSRLRSPNTQLLRRVADELRADLATIKDAIDLAVRTGEHPQEVLDSTCGRLIRVANTLSVLGLDVLGRVVRAQGDAIAALTGRDTVAPHEWMDFATAILRVEHSLDDALFRQLKDRRAPPDGHLEIESAERMPQAGDLRDGIDAILRESLVNLAKVKGAIEPYLRGIDPEPSLDVRRPLDEIAAALAVAGAQESRDVVSRLREAVEPPRLEQIRGDAAQTAAFADALAAIEYYIAAWRDGLPYGRQRLAEGLRRLGALQALAGPRVAAGALPEAADREAPGAPGPAEAESVPALPARSATAAATEPAATSIALEDVDPDIREVFLDEAAEVVVALRARLPQWLPDPGERDSLLDIRRAFHTLKGSGRMVGARELGEFAWDVENMLNRCLDGTITVDGPAVEVVRDAVGLLPELIERFRDARDRDEHRGHRVAERARAIADRSRGETDLAAVFRGDSLERLDEVMHWLARSGDERGWTAVPDEVVRAFHTVRGAAFAVDLPAVADLAGALESYLGSLREAEAVLGPEAAQLLGDAVTAMKAWVRQFGESTAPAPEVSSWLEHVRALQADAPAAPGQSITDRQLAEIFVHEAYDLIERCEANLRTWTQTAEGGFYLGEARQALHTLHGAALMSAAEPMAPIAQALWKRLAEYGGIAQQELPADLLPQLLELVEGLFQILDSYREGERGTRRDDLLQRIAALPAARGGDNAASAANSRVDIAVGAALDESSARSTAGLYGEPLPGFEDGLLPAVDDDAAELRDIFLEEAAELLDSVSQQLGELQGDSAGPRAVYELRRAFHTLRGSARMAGFDGIGEAGGRLEQLVSAIEQGRRDLDGATFNLLQHAAGQLGVMLEQIRAGHVPQHSSLLALVDADGAPSAPEDPYAPFDGAWNRDSFTAVPARPDDTGAMPAEDWSPGVLQKSQGGLEVTRAALGREELPLPAVPPEPAVRSKSPALAASWEAGGTIPATMAAEESAELAGELEVPPFGPSDAAAPDSVPPESREALATLDFADDLQLHRGIGDGATEPAPAGDPPGRALLYEGVAAAAGDAAGLAAEESQPSLLLHEQPTGEGAHQQADARNDAEASLDGGNEDLDTELAEIFSAEAAELLEGLDQALQRWSERPGETDALRDVQRMLHTLKGGARMSGLHRMGLAVHEMETGVNALEQGGEGADAEAFARLEAELEALRHMHDLLVRGDFAALRRSASPDASLEALRPALEFAAPVNAADAAGTAASLQPSPPATPAVPAADWDPALFWRPGESLTGASLAGAGAMRRESARVPVERLDSMLNEAGEISIFRSRLEQHNSLLQQSLQEMEQTITRVRDQLRMLDIETEAQIAARGLLRTETEPDSEFDPLEMDRYSRMQELSRALAESIADLSSLHQSMESASGEAETLLLQQARVNTDVQTGLMSTLMVPFLRQIPRLQRVVRQTASENGKQAELQFGGIEAELDRNLLDRMTAPLEHLLRNAIVHGIEPPEVRVAAGKPASGTIRVDLHREGTQLQIEVRDDGRGLDLPRIRDIAVRRGLAPAEAELSDDEIVRFIFAPGFSTAEKLTQDAGRGIGMDAVAAEVKQLGGALELRSEAGRGTRFLIRLPLTLAVSQALLVCVGEEIYALPLPAIEGITRMAQDEVAAYTAEGGRPLAYGGHEYRARHLGDFVGLLHKADPEARHLPVILMRLPEGLGTHDRRVAVLVDRLIGNRELVSKTLGPHAGSVRGLAGATILADGQVVLILDLATLAQDRALRDFSEQRARALSSAAASAHEDRRELIMVVDDSITMRRVAERLLTRNGYRVVTSKDGLDAMAMLQTEDPAAILLDIEMPRADGFEVAAFVRNTARIAGVPIVMITSRSGEKHRARARSLGVNRYLIKPYQEDQLLGELREVLVDAR